MFSYICSFILRNISHLYVPADTGFVLHLTDSFHMPDTLISDMEADISSATENIQTVWALMYCSNEAFN